LRARKKDTASLVVDDGFSALSLFRICDSLLTLELFDGLWNVKFVDFTTLKKRKYFPLVISDKRKTRSNLTYLSTYAFSTKISLADVSGNIPE
jgi:hypothetical protein